MYPMSSLLLGLLLILFSSIGSVIWNFLAKTSINKTVFFSMTLTGCTVTMLIVNLIGINAGFITFQLPENFLPIVIADGIMLVVTFTCLSFAYRDGEMSVVFPLWRLYPLFVYILGLFFLKEAISAIAVTGVVISVFGAYVMGLKKLTFSSLISPIKSLKNRVYILAIVAAFGSTISFLLQKSIVPRMSPFVYNVFLQGTGATLMVLLNALFLFKGKYITLIKEEWRKNKVAILIVAFVGPVTLIFTLYAFSYVPASIAAAFSQISIVLGTATGILFLKERDRIAIKLLSSLLIFAGIAVILFG